MFHTVRDLDPVSIKEKIGSEPFFCYMYFVTHSVSFQTFGKIIT